MLCSQETFTSHPCLHPLMAMPPHNLTSNPSCPLRKASFSLPVAPGPSSDSATILQTFRDTPGLQFPHTIILIKCFDLRL